MRFSAIFIFALCFMFVSPAMAEKKHKGHGKGRDKDKSSRSLFESAAAIEKERCGAGTCWVIMTDVTCTWVNDPKRTNHKCSYKNDAGVSKSVSGIQAKHLTRSIERKSKVDNNCGAGTCGFAVSQDVSCKRPTEKSKGECTTQNHVATTIKASPPKATAPVYPGVDPARSTN